MGLIQGIQGLRKRLHLRRGTSMHREMAGSVGKLFSRMAMAVLIVAVFSGMALGKGIRKTPVSKRVNFVSVGGHSVWQDFSVYQIGNHCFAPADRVFLDMMRVRVAADDSRVVISSSLPDGTSPKKVIIPARFIVSAQGIRYFPVSFLKLLGISVDFWKDPQKETHLFFNGEALYSKETDKSFYRYTLKLPEKQSNPQKDEVSVAESASQSAKIDDVINNAENGNIALNQVSTDVVLIKYDVQNLRRIDAMNGRRSRVGQDSRSGSKTNRAAWRHRTRRHFHRKSKPSSASSKTNIHNSQYNTNRYNNTSAKQTLKTAPGKKSKQSMMEQDKSQINNKTPNDTNNKDSRSPVKPSSILQKTVVGGFAPQFLSTSQVRV